VCVFVCVCVCARASETVVTLVKLEPEEGVAIILQISSTLCCLETWVAVRFDDRHSCEAGT